jgi:hypothetical protein
MNQPFAEEWLLSGWRDEAVDDDIIDEGQAHRTRIAEVVYRDRSRTAREDGATVECRQTVHIDCDIDRHLSNLACRRRVGALPDIHEAIDGIDDSPPYGAFVIGSERDTDDFEFRPVMPFEQFNQKAGDRMVAKIGRKICDADLIRLSALRLEIRVGRR